MCRYAAGLILTVMFLMGCAGVEDETDPDGGQRTEDSAERASAEDGLGDGRDDPALPGEIIQPGDQPGVESGMPDQTVDETVSEEATPTALRPEEIPEDRIDDRAEIVLDNAHARAFGLIQAGRLDAGRSVAESLLEEDEYDGLAHFLVALSYHQAFRYGTARPHFDIAATILPNYQAVHHFRGWCLYHLGKPEEAREAMLRHLELMPEEGDSHYVVGLVDLDHDDLESAEARFRKAVELQEGVPGREGSLANAYMMLGEISRRQGDFEAASEYLERSVELFPGNHQAWFRLSRTRMRLGDEAGADEAYDRYEALRRRQGLDEEFPE